MIKERYASAVNSSNLKSKVETTYSDSDVIGAYGLAARHHPLGVALQRLFVDGKARECVDLMAKMARDHSFKIKAAFPHSKASDWPRRFWHGTGMGCARSAVEQVRKSSSSPSRI